MRRAHCALGSISRERGSWDTNAKAPPMLSIGIAISLPAARWRIRSEEHTSELQSLMRTSYAVFCLKKKTYKTGKKKDTQRFKTIKYMYELILLSHDKTRY